MCGRYTLYHDEEDLTELFALDAFPVTPRYNVAPTQLVPIVRVGEGGAANAATPAGV
jgi:putative SOS response-associated peptidase YedK